MNTKKLKDLINSDEVNLHLAKLAKDNFAYNKSRTSSHFTELKFCEGIDGEETRLENRNFSEGCLLFVRKTICNHPMVDVKHLCYSCQLHVNKFGTIKKKKVSRKLPAANILIDELINAV